MVKVNSQNKTEGILSGDKEMKKKLALSETMSS